MSIGNIRALLLMFLLSASVQQQDQQRDVIWQLGSLTRVGEPARIDVRAEVPRPQASAQIARFGDWSAPVNGIRGRLIATPFDSAGRQQFKLELELENVGRTPTIDIWWSPFSKMLHFEVQDGNGNVLNGDSPGFSEAIPGPFWLQLPRESMIRFKVATRVYSYGSPAGVVLRPTPVRAWVLEPPPARLFISGVLRPLEDAERRASAWRGPLTLPRVEIPVPVR